MIEKIAELEQRLAEVNAALSDPSVTSDMKRMTALGKEYKELERVVAVGRKYRRMAEDIEGSKELIATETDEEMRELAKEELANLQPKLETLEAELKNLLIPKDPTDSKDVIMEIRAGTGGDEASLFAGDLFRMYQRYAEQKGWKFEVQEFHEGTVGGYKEVAISIKGEDVYGSLKFESGVHRVQRVPNTETQGRVHTSAATVLVMPEAEDLDVELNLNDVRKDTFCSSGAGGQSVNTTYSAVRLTHLPTGIVVSMQNERSQLKNYDLALKVLKSRLYDMELAKRQEAEAATRKSLVSSGDRSAKIRTYNFPQSRFTDHRIGLTLYNLQAVLAGELEEVIEALRIEENASKLNQTRVGQG
ncbi:MAG: peptide chain release factor 1 [Bacteroidetes bacterium]|jgi:peptide chain release factor 1|nr:peptide chain release factor 1 [Bacteroidota bacterium]